MQLVLLTFSLLTTVSFSQELDSTASKSFENFFGSDCPVDTMSEELSRNDYCFLDANKKQLSRIKKGDILWTVSLDVFDSSDYICMVIRPYSSNKKRKFVVFILAYKNEKEIGRMSIKFPSGKIIATTYKEIEIN